MLSINPSTGAVVWDVALLPAVPATALPCGDIDPVQVGMCNQCSQVFETHYALECIQLDDAI